MFVGVVGVVLGCVFVCGGEDEERTMVSWSVCVCVCGGGEDEERTMVSWSVCVCGGGGVVRDMGGWGGECTCYFCIGSFMFICDSATSLR